MSTPKVTKIKATEIRRKDQEATARKEGMNSLRRSEKDFIISDSTHRFDIRVTTGDDIDSVFGSDAGFAECVREAIKTAINKRMSEHTGHEWELYDDENRSTRRSVVFSNTNYKWHERIAIDIS